MALIEYIQKNLKPDTLARIDQANAIIDEYQAQGFDLTLRQLFYQHVARDLIPNTQKEYKRLGELLLSARMCGLTDWDAIVDRTRELAGNTHFRNPGHVISSAAHYYRIDKWEGQEDRVEVWIEKDALVGVLESCCPALDVDYFSCRGYVSVSSMHEAALRIIRRRDEQRTVILHLGDHDPSGIDMTRDIEDRLTLFCLAHGVRPPLVDRIALNMDQVEEHNPPPNPARITDSRFESYADQFGLESWELDALEPAMLVSLVQEATAQYRDDDLFAERRELEERQQAQLQRVADNWEDDEED